MTVEWYDLGQRLRATDTGYAVDRLTHSPVIRAARPVAVRARLTGQHVTVTAAIPSRRPSTATGRDALDLLGSLGVTLTAAVPATLVTDQPATLGLLHRLALTAAPNSDHDAVAAHIAWWRDRADFPAGRAVVDTVAACPLRWVTGAAPDTEKHPATWRRWLDLPDDSTSGLLAIHGCLTTDRPLPWLDLLAEDDVWAFTAAQSEYSDGLDWRRPDSTSRAAIGLRSRCDAADLYAAALLTDPLYRRRAVHTGHVASGTAHLLGDKLRRVEVSCDRMDVRLRPGNDVTGWVGTPGAAPATFSATVAATVVRSARLVFTLSGVGQVHGPGEGQPVTLMPQPPSVHRQRAGRRTYRALYSARRSWLTTGRTPTASRRPVPLDVLVAGAEPS